MQDLPSHASPVLAPQPRPSAHYLAQWDINNEHLHDSSAPSTPGVPGSLISPAFTPPSTPGLSGSVSGSEPATPSSSSHLLSRHQHHHLHSEPKSIPVDTSLDPPSTKAPHLLPRLPAVECVVRARIPTVAGAEMFLHLYQNDVDNKEHLAIVFGNAIRSRSLDREREGETEMDRMIRGAYVGRLRPGRISSRRDDGSGGVGLGIGGGKRFAAATATATGAAQESRKRAGSALKNVSLPPSENGVDPSLGAAENEKAQQQQQQQQQPQPQPQQEQKQDTSNQPSDEGEEPSKPPVPEDSSTTPSFPPAPFDKTTKPPLVRIHSECYTGETAWSARCDCGEQLDEAARLMSMPPAPPSSSFTTKTFPFSPPHPLSSSSSPGGVIVYLRQEGRGIGLSEKLKAYNLQDLGSDTVEANLLLRHPADARSYGLATAILLDLGLGGDRGIRLLTNNPDKVRAVEGPGREIRVRERVAMVPISWRTGGKMGVQGRELQLYLETKIGRMGHMIEEERRAEERKVEEGRVQDGDESKRGGVDDDDDDDGDDDDDDDDDDRDGDHARERGWIERG